MTDDIVTYLGITLWYSSLLHTGLAVSQWNKIAEDNGIGVRDEMMSTFAGYIIVIVLARYQT